MGAWFCHVDDRAQAGNNCNRLRIRENENAGNANTTLFDTGAIVGKGYQTFMMPGILWQIGPYRLRAAGGIQRYSGGNNSTITQTLKGDPRANMFLIGHDIFLWSPKGFLTGSANTPGSVLFGTHFERVDVSVDCAGSAVCLAGLNGGQFHRDRFLVREWDLWYFVAPSMSIGAHFVWYDASNLTGGSTGSGAKITENNNFRNAGGADWVNVILNWRYTF
jgi:hypothetical protein